MRVLAGDIGGTSTRLAVVELGPERVDVLAEHHFPSRDAPGLESFVRAFLAEARVSVQVAAFGIAGPVVDGVCRTPNLPWVVSARALERELGLERVTVLNDFAALGHGLERLGPEDVAVLQEGTADREGTVALIGAGTGLGEGYLVPSRDHMQVRASEGGHASFAPRDDTEWALTRFLSDRYGHVSRERVLSGPGLVDIYRFVAARGEAPEDPAIARAIEEAAQPAAIISSRGLERSDALCARALDIFARAYGAAAGDLALTVLATGGVYVGGGIAPRILAKLKDGAFMDAFRDKGRLGELARRVPVRVVVSPRAGLIGAAVVASET